MGLDVVRLKPDEWETYRAIRLAALRDAPSAFGSTLAEAERQTEATWRGRLETSPIFVARLPELDGVDAGLIGAYLERETETYELVSMWVRPEARGRGVSDALVQTVLDWVADAGADQVHLWVTESNQPARRLYERCGFSYTGERAPLPSDPTLSELGMVRSL
jgi:GNAT superfamily N-acetyltransferase